MIFHLCVYSFFQLYFVSILFAGNKVLYFIYQQVTFGVCHDSYIIQLVTNPVLYHNLSAVLCLLVENLFHMKGDKSVHSNFNNKEL